MPFKVSLMLQASLAYMCSSFLGLFPGLTDLAEWLWNFAFRPPTPPPFPFTGIVLLSSLLSSYTFTGLLLPSSFPSGPHVHFAPEPEAGRTHTDEAGRSNAASPTLSSGASICKRESGEKGFFFSVYVDQCFVLLPIS